MSHRELIVNLEGAVATVRMNNPAKLNALSMTLTADLIEAMTAMRDDPTVRAIVLTGDGRGFCAGADLSALREPYERGERPDLRPWLEEGYNRLIPLVAEMPKPVIAAVNGAAVGAGLSLALACDIRVVAAGASFSMGFVRIGLVPDSGAAYFLPRAVGRALALELAITGERVSAERAVEIGLANRLVPPDELEAEVARLAADLAGLPTAAIGLTKKLFRDTADATLPETLRAEAEAQIAASATGDHLEGVLAFIHKRPPSFTGR